MILRIVKIYCQKYLAPHSSLRQGMNVDYFWGKKMRKKHFIFDFEETIQPEAPFAGLKLGWNWLKNTVLAEMLWGKNTVPAKKKAEQAKF